MKSDSSDSNPPLDSDLPTLVDFPKYPSDPEATLVDAGTPVDPDATLVDVDATLAEGISPPPSFGRKTARVQAHVPLLQTGDVLGGRYEILQMLGEGGMGAVYKARDRELDRFVALKLIRPELAANPAIVARFKQELLLSHQVTHRNVVRIYDLGDADGVKFITMEFVEGQDLRTLILEKQKFPPEEAVEMIQQVCRALEAAHAVGVIHRDLKPQNVMRDKAGRILVMDFGMARTLEGDGMTQTGALVGTMEYMSPEQALAGNLDQRSDLFAVGLILYELLSGKMPYKAESALASLIKRNQERAIPVSDHDGTIPRALSNIVSKCLERDVNLRYQTATELLAGSRGMARQPCGRHIGFSTGGRALGTDHSLAAGDRPRHRARFGDSQLRFSRRTVFAIVQRRLVSGPTLSLAILPFRNASGDPQLDWLGPSLADMLSTDVGQSAHLRTVVATSCTRYSDLRIAPNASVEPATIRRVADFSNADRVVWGQFASSATRYASTPPCRTSSVIAALP